MENFLLDNGFPLRHVRRHGARRGVFQEPADGQEGAQRSAPLTAAQEKLLDIATAIRLEPDAVERAYMARQLVQCTLPLFRCRISFDEQASRGDGAEGKRWLDMQVVQKGE